MLSNEQFQQVLSTAPLVSIDVIVKNKQNKVLLGKRINKPAKGFYFTTGGRVRKNETLHKAMGRIAKMELGIMLKSVPEFLGVFEHFYEDSVFDNASTHYINLAYEYNVDTIANLPVEQHSEYKWFNISELMRSEQVHNYVKDYFRG